MSDVPYTSLLIGCPVYKRGWILPRWFEHVERACGTLGVDFSYAFILDDRDDDTLRAIEHHKGVGYCFSMQQADRADERVWNADRYRWMVELRNGLLHIARLVEPRWFLSVDSDVLLHPNAVANLLESIDGWDACGGKAYMTALGRHFPSYASGVSRSGGLVRADADGVFPVEVIMGIKLMTPAAYNVDYEFHDQGEDIGWSLACRKAGLRLRWDGRVTNKHVMEPSMLDVVDERCGF